MVLKSTGRANYSVLRRFFVHPTVRLEVQPDVTKRKWTATAGLWRNRSDREQAQPGRLARLRKRAVAGFGLAVRSGAAG
jgi:hypothetical protein